MTRIRTLTAENTSRSLAISPHVWTSVEVDLEPVEQLRQKHKDRFRQEEGVGLTYLVVPAVDLSTFTGGFDAPDPVVSAAVLVVPALAVLGVVALALLGVTTFANRRRAGDLLRTGADE